MTNLTTAQLQKQIADLKAQLTNAKVKEAKIEKQQSVKLDKLMNSIYSDLKDRLTSEVKIDSENCFKVSLTIDLAGNKFKEVSYKKVLRAKLLSKSKAIKLQSEDTPSIKKSSFKKGQMKLQG